MIEDKLSTKQLAVIFRTIADEFFPLSDFPIHILDFPEDEDDNCEDRMFYSRKHIRNKILMVADDIEKL